MTLVAGEFGLTPRVRIAVNPFRPTGGGPLPPPPGPTITPGSGIGIPGTGGAARICPPGTACRGMGVRLPGGITGCLGSCAPLPPDAGDRLQPDYSGAGIQDPTGGAGCDAATQAYCSAMCGAGANGAKCASMGSCQLPNGRGGKLNKSKYYTFGDCRRGTTAGVVMPGTKCVKPRRMNPANAKASARAARRVTAAIKHQDRLVKAMKKAMRGR